MGWAASYLQKGCTVLLNQISKTERLTHLEGKKARSSVFFSAAFRRHFVLPVPVRLGSSYELVVALHDGFCFKDTDIDDLEDLPRPFFSMNLLYSKKMIVSVA